MEIGKVVCKFFAESVFIFFLARLFLRKRRRGIVVYIQPFFLAHPVAAEPFLLLRIKVAVLHMFSHLVFQDFATFLVPEILVQERRGHKRHRKSDQ